MRIRKAPIEGLLKYVENSYVNREKFNYQHILYLVDDYYCSLTKGKSIVPVGELFIEDWCDLDNSTSMENCPNTPGVIVYRKNPKKGYDYGLLYHSGSIVSKELQTNYLAYFDIDKNGTLLSRTYNSSEWEGWGAPTRYFDFKLEEYIESDFWNLGERPLSEHCVGHDVRVLQHLLSRKFPEVKVTSFFDQPTIEALHKVQSSCGLDKSNILNTRTPDGRKIMGLLSNED